MKLLGVDTGGTFTDLVLWSENELHVHKILSTPATPEQAIIKGVKALAPELQEINAFTHGSTVATNAVLEKKGVKTAYITCRGFKDILTLGRQARTQLYHLNPTKTTPPVPPELCLETGGRLSSCGEVLDDLTPQDIATLKQQLRELSPDAVAVNLLFSFIDNRFEKMIADALKDNYFTSISSELFAECREYERGMVTWLNSYVGPLMHNYLGKLDRAFPDTEIRVMQSHGQTISADKAGSRAVNLLLSGPAGGVIAVKQIAALCGHTKVLSFDMGGTSTDVSIIDGEIALTNEGHIGPYPVCVPMIDIHTIGSGGSSIAYCDAGGLLRVGPESAGAAPGPACYHLGGKQPTVTDANLILNRLPQVIGNGMKLSLTDAKAALEPIAAQLDMRVEQVAQGILDIVNEQMTHALRLMSAQKGENPAEYLLVGFGAAGGLHICKLAENMQMTKAMVPIHAGILSALGMLTSEQGVQKSQTLGINLHDANEVEINRVFKKLAAQAEKEMHEQNIRTMTTEKFIDLRYHGQWHCLTFPYHSLSALPNRFHQAHKELQGYQLDAPIELVTAKVHATSPAQIDMAAALNHASVSSPQIPPLPAEIKPTNGIRWLHRNSLGAERVQGPAVIIDAVATTYLEPGWEAYLDSFGNLYLNLMTSSHS